MEEHIEHRRCKQCGHMFQFDVSGEIKSCPLCGSNELQQQLFPELKDGIRLSEMQKGTIKDKKLSSEENPVVDFVTGVEPQKANGSVVYKERLIDKKKTPHWYQEKVVDPESGKTIHECSEPLAEHKGHGSAKKKDNPPTRSQ